MEEDKRWMTDVPCPVCSLKIVYDGNYYCTCGWAMDDDSTLFLKCYLTLMKNRGEEPNDEVVRRSLLNGERG